MTMNENDQASRKKGNGREPAFSVIDRRPTLREDVPEAAGPRYPSVVEELKARAEDAERRAREISAAYRLIEEDRDAFRERLTRDLERRVDLARAAMMRKILDVLDDLDRAIAAGKAAGEAGPLLSGVTLIRDRLLQVLASEGVQALSLVGQRFDPALAEAVSIEDTRDPDRDNLVLAESGRGYMLGATLLRPARVRVARWQAPEDRAEPGAGTKDRPQGAARAGPEPSTE